MPEPPPSPLAYVGAAAWSLRRAAQSRFCLLERVFNQEPGEMVREHAAWALARVAEQSAGTP